METSPIDLTFCEYLKIFRALSDKQYSLQRELEKNSSDPDGFLYQKYKVGFEDTKAVREKIKEHLLNKI